MRLIVGAVRLAKYLASAGVASRRAAEEIVRAGRVTVGGEPVRDPARDVSEADEVAVDGNPVAAERERVVFALNKPAGVVSTARDTHGRRTVVSLVPSELRLYPVGRLDADSTGLILLTNDGELANRLTHPRFEIEKSYHVVVGGGPVAQRDIEALRRGVKLDDGMTAPARVRRIAADTLELTIHEGRNRQVKRMCDHIGHPVRSLTRIRFGGLELGDLKVGAYRKLTEPEIARLSAARAARRDEARSSSGSRRSRAG
jgi:23S rRNA pseudouridine2605 synthase